LDATEPWPRGRRRVAKTAACPVFLVRQESQERTVNRVNLDHLAHQASLDAHRWRFADLSLRRHANRAHRVQLDLVVHQANQEHQAPTATLATQAKMAALDHPAHQDPTAQADHLARTERKEDPVPQPFQFHQLPVMPARQPKMDHQDPPVNQVHPAQTALQAQLVPKAHPALLDPQATMALQETKDHQVQMDPRESQVFAPNTAPPTAVSSSRMAQGDKRPGAKSLSTMSCDFSKIDISNYNYAHLPLTGHHYFSIVILLVSMSFASFKATPS
jgi:hypothetical protein